MRHILFCGLTNLILSILALVYGTSVEQARAGPSKVTLVRTPDGGIQPQVAVGHDGTLHLIYFKGNAEAGDLFYVRRGSREESFSKPLRVNSEPGSVLAIGTVRGAHIALGKGGRVHVAWMGSGKASPPQSPTPMFYARLTYDKTAFEPQRNVMQFAAGLDGGSSVAADESGHVYIVWHAKGDSEGEANRRVWIALSKDEGETFSREVPAYRLPTGACGCCGMRAFADRRGTVYVLYRAASEGVNRDMFLLISEDSGQSFYGVLVHKWKINACPMSTAFLAEGDRGVLMAWETEGQVYYAGVDPTTSLMSSPIAPAGEGKGRRHPVVAGNAQGEKILVWTEGTGWKKGGFVAWQVFDKADKPTEERGQAEGVAVWSLAAAFANSDGGFTVVY
jgi:hypothetical protein